MTCEKKRVFPFFTQPFFGLPRVEKGFRVEKVVRRVVLILLTFLHTNVKEKTSMLRLEWDIL
jgi:hypothetical protein